MKEYVIEKADLLHNAAVVLERCPGTLFGVVKANGYGLGLEAMAGALAEAGVQQFAVCDPAELVRLRAAGFAQPVLVMRSTCLKEEAETILENGGIATIGSPAAAKALEDAAQRLETQGEAHLKIDVGMSRYGFLPEEIESIRETAAGLTRIQITGCYTHFPNAFGDTEGTKRQLDIFTATVDRLKAAGVNPGLCHAANSAALFSVEGAGLDAARCGSALLGRMAVPGEFGLRKIGRLRTRIMEIKTVQKGAGVGYLSAYRAKSDRRLAILPIGNADGFGTGSQSDVNNLSAAIHGAASSVKRFLRRRPAYTVEIGGRQCPVVGHIGLNHTAVDITGTSAALGDEVWVEMNPLHLNTLVPRAWR